VRRQRGSGMEGIEEFKVQGSMFKVKGNAR
jgi:hypothetical protein